MRQILADYDVADISPRAFSEMLQKLRQAGALSEKDFQELASIRLDVENENSAPDQRLNLVELYGKRLAAIRQQQGASQVSAAARPASEATLQRQLGWLQKFAQIRAGTSPLGFDTLA
jgi:ribosome-binding protein aMBF1 (putative translation factor)